MNKMLSRLTRTGTAFYFAVLLCFCAVAAIMEQYTLATVELVITGTSFVFFQIFTNRRKREVLKYLQSTTATMTTALKGESPFPMAIISISNNEIYWSNNLFSQLTGTRNTAFDQKLDSVLPGFSARWLAEGKTEYPQDYTLGERRYRIVGNQVHSGQQEPSLFLATVYFLDNTELFNVRDLYVQSRPIVSIILVDNYDELQGNLPDSLESTLNAEINTIITRWVDGMDGMLRKIERNRYVFVFEAKDLPRLVEEKFAILDSIRAVTNPSGVAATLSIGIGKDGHSYQENYNFAALSIEMSLSRGGDQAVIKDSLNFSFFGGKTVETERRTKVKSRVIASSLGELIAQSSSILVMSHKNADIDAIGSAVGVCCICRKKGKQAHIVVDKEHNAAESLIAMLETLPEYEDCFITSDDAMLMADSHSLLVVVDTNRPDQVESKPLLEAIPRVAVIDHHRRAADYIERVVLNLHEPFVSSASELVTELLQYAVDTKDILPAEAHSLLAGIVLDTKNFSVRTGSRTFEAAAFLRRTGADTVDVKKLFQNNLTDTVSRYKIIQAARLYRGNIAISALDYTANRIIAAQASDELLNISGISASFVLYPDGEKVIISARSIGDANVQVILEPLGGGGNAATAGAQIKATVDEVVRDLVSSIDRFFE